MIVVLPYCHKDAGMAVKQLRWAKRLDSHAPLKCLLVHDKEVPDGDVQAVHEAAANYFDAVEEFVCSVWPGMHKQWPFPQNHQYQETATKMFLLQKREPWFWWQGGINETSWRSCSWPF